MMPPVFRNSRRYASITSPASPSGHAIRLPVRVNSVLRGGFGFDAGFYPFFWGETLHGHRITPLLVGGFHDHEGFNTPESIETFMIMAADTGEAGEVVRVGLEGLKRLGGLEGTA